MTFEKEALWHGLSQQRDLMIANAEKMEAIYAHSPNATELRGASNITQDWMNVIKDEIEEDIGVVFDSYFKE